ncbi:MAG: hypothetical protein ETSY1_26130 [Candidatus Entotheonella factor]|uniref:Sulfatase-modifying factor enzyme-like domain-containing protein n=1 Tax=Entotheonella factor TaxID=1429438 RepID=W4LF62_ENTF1|nr:MAG: hypothetical protein ETSY1_26130 [Candidatus Entotheonella factor]
MSALAGSGKAMAEPIASLDDFLAALRHEGIPIGLREHLWLQHALQLAPSPERLELKALLACTLVKQEVHRERFEALFEIWHPPEPGINETASETPDSPLIGQTRQQTPATPKPAIAAGYQATVMSQTSVKRWRISICWMIGLVLLCLVGLGYMFYSQRPSPPVPAVKARPDLPPPPPAKEIPPDAPQPAKQFWTWVPEITITTPSLWVSAGLPGTVAILALLGGAGLWRRYHRRTAMPPSLGPPVDGPSWLPLAPLDPIGPEFLSRDDLRMAVWGVERFVSEDITHRVDLSQTVTDTARAGGLPVVRFEHAIYPRDVWLWCDEMVQDPVVNRVLNELEQSLSQAGLPVRLGTFDDIPDRVCWDNGQELSPLALEGHRQSAVVVILTDGHGMRLIAESELDQSTLDTVLLAFTEWPRLVFVDVSEGQHGLAGRLEPYGLECIVLGQLPAFLGASPVSPMSKHRADAALHGDLQVWAAATALSPEPVEADRAFALRDHLKLPLSSWLFHDLLVHADSVDQRLDWPPDRRAALLNWFTQCSTEHSRIGENSHLAQALDYWLQHYRSLDAEQSQSENSLLPWRQTQAQRRLRMEIALLELWRKPVEAVKDLYQLYGNDEIARGIRERFRTLTDRDGGGSEPTEMIALPWREAEQPLTVRWMLALMGFGGRETAAAGRLQKPVGLSLVLGGCVGLAVVGFALASWHLFGLAEPVFRPMLPTAFEPVIIQAAHRTSVRTYDIAVGGPKHMVVQSAPAQSVVELDWTWTPLDNIVKLGNSELWRAGTLPQAIRGCEPGWPRRSLVVVEAEPSALTARELAMALLDRGSADAVLLGMDWAAHQQRLIQLDPAMTAPDQLLLILSAGADQSVLTFQGAVGMVRTDDLQNLTDRLKFDGVKSLTEVWPQAEGEGRLRGGPEKKLDEASGITFVTVCGGTFRMGSTEEELEIIEKQDRELYRDELPKHTVTMNAFEIGETEVTNAQFRTWRADHPGEDTLPVTEVIWNDAQAFCESVGAALPTEAQWEYAARGGSVSHWSFGNDAAQLGTYAWFFENSGDRAHPVKDKEPNPLGLYDMHGNVWEWVADCYDPKAYTDRSELIRDPQETTTCGRRVLRGGSAWAVSRLLRSASRDRDEPADRNFDIGFRCARRSRRQP